MGSEGTASDLSAELELAALVDAFPDVGFILDREGTYVEVLSSPESEDLLYDDPQSLIGRNVADVFDGEDARRLSTAIEESVEVGELRRVEYTLEVPAGTRTFEARIHPVEGAPADYVVFVARDVTERRRHERELERQRGYMQELLESTDDLFVVLNLEGELVDWNCRVLEVTGRTDLESLDARELFEDQDDRVVSLTGQALRDGRARGEATVLGAEEDRIPYEFLVTPFESQDGKRLFAAFGREITERKRRERALQRRRDLLDGVLDSVDDVFCLLDSEGRIVRWNESARAVIDGEDPTEPETPVAFFDESDRDAVADALVRGYHEGQARVVADCIGPDGDRYPYEFVANAFERGDGETMLACIGRDVTERKRRQKQVRVFGRVLRHDIRNKLGIVQAATERIEREADVPREDVERIESAIYDLMTTSEKAHDVTSFLLENHTVERVDLSEKVQRAVDTCRQRYPGADVELDVGQLEAIALPAIRRAVVELVENGIVHGEGTVTVATDQRDGRVSVWVTDEGPGLPETETDVIEGRTEITPLTHGSGLGLWLANWIVDRSGGRLRFPEQSVVELQLRTHDATTDV